MEDIAKYLQGVESNLFESSTSSDTDCSSETMEAEISKAGYTKKCSKLNSDGNSKKSRCERLPTRRPDPNVYNRNALLARENRRKKKALMETMEKELEEVKRVNRNLMKVLKKQLKVVKKLEHEKNYYKNILVNQSEIQSLVTALNCRFPIKSPHNVEWSFNQHAGSEYSAGSIRSSCNSIADQGQHAAGLQTPEYDSETNLVVRQDSFLSPITCLSQTSCSDFPNGSFTDFDTYSPNSKDWNELLDNEYALSEYGIDYIEAKSSTEENAHDSDGIKISNDHNYVSSTKTMFKTSDSKTVGGICLHIGQGKVSLEFCANCNLNTHSLLASQ